MIDTILAVDLGGTKLLIGEVTQSGEILSQVKASSDVTSQRVAINAIKKAVQIYLKTAVRKGNIIGIGIGMVGRMDTEKGIWYEIHPELADEINVRREFSEFTEIPVFIANDVYCATLAELLLGFGTDTKSFVYMNIGTGIAGRIVDKGKVMVGNHFDSGEIGHMVVDMNSNWKCICGRKGCVEPISSGLGMHNQAVRFKDEFPDTIISFVDGQRIGARELMDGYEKQDELSKKVINQSLKGLATLIMNMVRVSDPEAIILGGGVMSSGWMLERLEPLLDKKTMRFVKKGVHVTNLDSSTIALKGSAMLGFKNVKE